MNFFLFVKMIYNTVLLNFYSILHRQNCVYCVFMTCPISYFCDTLMDPWNVCITYVCIYVCMYYECMYSI